MNMLGKGVVWTVTAVFICILLTVASGNTLPNKMGEVEVLVETEENPVITLVSNDLLFSVEYTHLQFRPVGGGITDVPLNGTWDVSMESMREHRFPHVSVVMDSSIPIQGKDIDLLFHLNVLSVKDTVEITFYFEIGGLDENMLGDFFVVQHITVNGQIYQRPEDISPVMYYQFNLPGDMTGYYSWSSLSHLDGLTSDTLVDVVDDHTIFLGVRYDHPESSMVHISSIELESTMSGSAVVPLPKSFDRLPSFLVGMMVAGGFVVGLLAQERRSFYRKQDPAEVVRLKDSPYYKGRE